MSLVVRRNEGESWRDCVKRVAGKYGLERECLREFDRETITEGRSDEGRCAWEALCEWDCLAYEPEPVAKGDRPAPSPAGSQSANGNTQCAPRGPTLKLSQLMPDGNNIGGLEGPCGVLTPHLRRPRHAHQPDDVG